MSHTSISANLVPCDKSLSVGAERGGVRLLSQHGQCCTTGAPEYTHSPWDVQEHVGVRPGLPVALPIS